MRASHDAVPCSGRAAGDLQQSGCMAPHPDRGVICGTVRWMLKTRSQPVSGWASAVCNQASEIVLSECRRLT